MGLRIFIITDVLCLIFTILELIGNALVLRLFITKKFDSRRNFRLFLYLAIADFIFGIMILPHVIYMIFYWRPEQLDYDPQLMAYLGMPFPFFLKFTGGLNCGAAIERILTAVSQNPEVVISKKIMFTTIWTQGYHLALFFPFYFRRLNHIIFSNIVVSISLICSLFDIVFATSSFRFIHIDNCSSFGCFLDDDFRVYWGTSNMVISLCIVILSSIVFMKIQKRGDSLFESATHKDTRGYTVKFRKFRLANRTTCGILISTLVCTSIPSLIVSLFEKIAHYPFSKIVGPFYMCSLLANAMMNSCIFLVLNIGSKSHIDMKHSSDIIPNAATTGDAFKNMNSQPVVIS